MRAAGRLIFGIAALAAIAPIAQAADAPAIVIPGKPGVPVIINGLDASYGIVEGDWGLDRPGHVPPTIIMAPLLAPAPGYASGYFPAFGRRPGYGRHEVEPPPNRRLPPPAEPYHRFWGTASDPLPASLDPPVPVQIDGLVGVGGQRPLDRRNARDDDDRGGDHDGRGGQPDHRRTGHKFTRRTWGHR